MHILFRCECGSNTISPSSVCLKVSSEVFTDRIYIFGSYTLVRRLGLQYLPILYPCLKVGSKGFTCLKVGFQIFSDLIPLSNSNLRLAICIVYLCILFDPHSQWRIIHHKRVIRSNISQPRDFSWFPFRLMFPNLFGARTVIPHGRYYVTYYTFSIKITFMYKCLKIKMEQCTINFTSYLVS